MSEIVLPDDGGDGGWGSDPDLEARLVSLIMGEASAFEAESIERLIEQRPEVEVIKRRLEEVHGLVQQTVRSGCDEAWKLSSERRARVMKALGIGEGGNGSTEGPKGNGEAKEGRIRKASRRVLWAAAACIMINVILFGWLIGKLASGEKGSYSMTGAPGAEWMATFEDESGSMEVRASADAVPQVWNAPESEGKASPPVPLPASKPSSVALGSETLAVGSVSQRAGDALASLGKSLGSADNRIAEIDEKQVILNNEIGAAADPFGGDDDLVPLSTFQGGTATGQSTNVEFRRRSELTDEERAQVIAGVAPVPVPKSAVPATPDNKKVVASESGEADPFSDEGADPFSDGGADPFSDGGADPFGSDPDELAGEARISSGQRMKVPARNFARPTAVPVPEPGPEPDSDLTLGGEDQVGTGWGSGGIGGGGEFGGRPDDATVDAESLLHEGWKAYAEGLEYLDDPIRSNPALADRDAKEVDQVRRNLYTAEGYKNLGLYDQAIEEYQKTLRTDPHNSAARRGMESVHGLKSDYYRSAYDETRARMLSEVDQAWEMAVPPPVDEGGGPGRGQPGAPLAGSEAIEQKMKEIVIPDLNLEDATVDEAMEIIRQKAEELDRNELDPKKKGINFVVRKPRLVTADEELDPEGGLGALDPGQARVKNLKLKNVPVGKALQYVADQARLRYKVDEYAVTLLPLGSGEGDDILTRKFKVGPTFLTDIESGAEGEADEADPFGGGDSGLGGGSLRPRRPLIDILKDAGIDFPPGASAQFIPSSGTLIISNTPSNLDLMDSLTSDVLAAGPSEAPFVDPELFRPLDELNADKTMGTWQKLRSITVPEVNLKDVSVAEALTYFNGKLRGVRAPDGQPVGIRLGVQSLFGDRFEAEASGVDAGKERIQELKLRNVPLGTALYHVANQAGLELRVEDEEVTLQPAGGGEVMVTRKWHLDPAVMDAFKTNPYDEPGSGEPDPFGDGGEEEEEGPELIRPPRPLIEELMDCGIDFPPNSSVRYVPETRTLIVENTEANLDLVDQLFVSVATELSQRKQYEQEVEESLEIRAEAEPFSTFSLHISDVSFKLAKATLAKGEWPVAGQIRVEEFVNAFDYDEPTPTMREKVACRMEQAAHPFMQQRNLLRIAMRTAALGRAGGTPLRLTVLLDNSGSMERIDRVESVQRAFDLLAAQLNGNDQVTLISFARSPRLLADRVSGDQAGTLSQLVAGTPSEGGTNLEEALRLGLAKAREQKEQGGQNRIILLTDGAANLGNARPAELAKLVEEMREEEIAFDACGVGAEGLNDEILESLTRKGDGRYYFLDQPEDADEGFAKQIAGALRPAAKNVKVQVQFNPQRVGRYKLFGFEKHLLEKEDFRNDSVDAAEMAAEEAGNAVYQVEILPEGAGEIGTVWVRFQDTASGRMVERSWVIPYEGGVPRLESAAPAIRLAASAAFLGEKLNGSLMGERVRLGELARVVNGLKAEYPKSDRVQEFLEMVGRAREVE